MLLNETPPNENFLRTPLDDAATKLTLSWVTLRCTNYPRPRRVLLTGSQALRFSRISSYIVKPNVY